MCITKGERKISRSHLPNFSFGKISNKKIKYILHKSSYIQNRIGKKTSSLLSNTDTREKNYQCNFSYSSDSFFILVPVTISIPHRDSSLLQNDNISLFLLNITSIDWYLISTLWHCILLHQLIDFEYFYLQPHRYRSHRRLHQRFYRWHLAMHYPLHLCFQLLLFYVFLEIFW